MGEGRFPADGDIGFPKAFTLEVFSVYLIDLEKKNQDVSTINITKKLHINLTYIDLASSV